MADEITVQASLRLKLHKKTLIAPAEPTRNHSYFLSNIDQNLVVVVRTVFCYWARIQKGHAPDPVRIIKEALRKVLVMYYPLAGRFGISEDSKLNVNCNAKGVVFVEAEADCPLEYVLGNTIKPNPAMFDHLVYRIPGAKNILETPPLLAQVTKFKCGGFALGLAMNHCMFDGRGAMEFVNSWSEAARGLLVKSWSNVVRGPNISVPPIYLDRTILGARSPPRIEYPHIEFSRTDNVSNPMDASSNEALSYTCMSFSKHKIKRLQMLAMREGNVTQCSAFEVLTAHVWRCRIRALEMAPNQETKLLFAVDGRSLFEPPLPSRFFGNAVVLTPCLCKAEDLTDQPLSFAVELVQKAIAMVNTDKYVRSAIDYLELHRLRPSLTATLFTWCHFSFHSVDFGWGQALYTGPVNLPAKDIVLFMRDEMERNDMIKIVLCLPPRCIPLFLKYIQNFYTSNSI